jgi:transposase-like protein
MSKQLEFMTVAQMTKEQAREMIESIRWPDGPNCPHCESTEAYKLTPKPDSKRPVRPGVYKCKACKKQFTVTVGTIFEGSRIPLNKWLMAIYLMCASKKGISAHQLHRQLGITYKSAWFMCHRIRYAMTQEPLFGMLTGTVEADETYIGGKMRGGKRGRGSENKTPVAALVERGGRVKAKKVARVDGKTLKGNIRENVDPSSHIVTDEFLSYRGIDREFASHRTVNHGRGEYVRGDVYTNTAESFFALLKRGVVGTFHHVSEQHLDRYVDEFSFRWNMRDDEDGDRAVKAIVSSKGKRLYYREPSTKG